MFFVFIVGVLVGLLLDDIVNMWSDDDGLS